MAAIKAVCSHVEDWKPWGYLMSSAEPIPGPAEALVPLTAVGERAA